ncbi:MAG: PDZ domain-containing protein [bacterium]|nr:MAG: PDZ domain-containing protein [bacterium]
MKKLLIIVITVCVASALVSTSQASADIIRSGQDGIYVVRTDATHNEDPGMTTIIVTSPDKIITEDEEGLIVVGDDDGDKEIKVVKSKKKGGYLGIYMEELTRKLIRKSNYPHKKGVLISEVVEDSPADEAGLMEDDIIYLFGGKEVDCPSHLSALVNKKKPGEEVEIGFYRDGKKIETTATIGERATQYSSVDWERIEDFAQDLGKSAKDFGKAFGYYWKSASAGRGKLGLTLAELNEDLAGYFKVKEDEGVLVLEVHEGSPADEAGIKSGDVIVMVGDEDISEVEDVLEVVRDLEEGDEVTVKAIRSGKEKTFTVEIEDWEGAFFLSPLKMHHSIEVPEIELHDLPEIESIDQVEFKKEMQELKKELKRLKKRLEELEKEQ